ncbi:MAG: transcription antitermination factor NusB [Bacteroidota bacterium]
MNEELSNLFPLSKKKSIKGGRRLAREKVFQILASYELTGVGLDNIFGHVFFREFNFGEDEVMQGKLLKPAEIIELESDTPIIWNKDEIEFAQKLIRETIDKKDYINSILDEFSKNWKLDRIALLDRIVLHMSVTELMLFEAIPVKVTVNEAIDISKKYSTEKSGIFINGLLDAIIKKLEEEKKIKKTGKGLLERSKNEGKNNK